MADYVATTEDMTTVADAIRTKGGTSAPLSFPDEFASAIQAIAGPKPEQEKEVTITENGDVTITADVGKVLSKVLAHVNVPTGGGGGGDVAPFKAIEVMTYTPVSDTQNIILEGVPLPAAIFLTAVPAHLSAPTNTGVGCGYAISANNALNAEGSTVGVLMPRNESTYADSKPIFLSGGASTTNIMSFNKQTPFKAGREYIIVCFRM